MRSSADPNAPLLGASPPAGTPPGLAIRRRWWDRLGLRLLALVVASATFPTLILGLLVIRSGGGTPEREVLARNQEVARWGAEKVESFVGNALENMRLLTNLADLDRPNRQDPRPDLSLFLVEQPLAEALASVRQTTVETLVMLLNTFLAAVLAGALAARYVTRPVRALAAGAAVVGAGDVSRTIPVRGRDELAEVAGTFNWMTANLHQSFQGLRTLLETTTRLAGAARREDVLRLAVKETPRVVAGVRAAVLLLEGEWDGREAVQASIWHAEAGGADATLAVRPGEDHPVLRALSSQHVVVTRAGALDLPMEGNDPEAPALVLPLLTGRQARGALLVVRSAGDQDFGEAEVMLCRTLANHLNIALQLREAHEHLVRSEKLRAVGEIAAGVAHNFNNILGAILARAQLLQDLSDPAEVLRGLTIIERAALDGAGIVRRLQNSARLQPATPLGLVALKQVVEDALELTRPRWKDAAELRGSPIALETALGRLPAVLGDPMELREVMTNIILNAVDAMPSGGRLRIEGGVWDGWVTLAFRDTGTGMSEDVRRRIFDPFFTTKGAQGTGLGMSLSYAIVKRHGGEILVESAIGQGTSVHLRLPIGPAPPPPLPVSERGLAPSIPRRILVVDDDVYVRGLLSDVLTSLGHEVEAVDSGTQALGRFAAEAFDMVITDLGMELSGRDVARAIKARSPDTPVILVTGWAADLDEAELQEASVDLVLAKPFQVSEVRDVVDRVSECRTGRRH